MARRWRESIYAEIEAKVRARLAAGRTRPMLATLLVGDDPASATYVRMKQRNCERVGIASSDHRLPASATTDECIALVAGLDADEEVSAILVQMPMPPQVDAEAVVEAISPVKDVDGLHPFNAGRLALGLPVVKPCTPAGIMGLLAHYEVPLAGGRAVVVGRSNLVRQAGGAPAPPGSRDGDDLPQPDGGPGRCLPRGRHPGLGDR